MSKFKIMSERCNQCLFGPDKIVSNKRRAEILRDIRRRDSHFICHKASIAGVEIACRGDWDQNGCGQLGRIMGRLGGIEFVSEPDAAPAGETGTAETEGLGAKHEHAVTEGQAPR